MFQNKLLTAPRSTKDFINQIFMIAALKFVNGLDWRSYFVKIKNTTIGLRKEFCEFWLSKTDKQFAEAIDRFIIEMGY